MKIIFDNNLSPHIAKALDYLMQCHVDEGHEYIVTSVKEKFGRGDLPDTELLGKLGEEGGWVLMSGDHNIRKRPHEVKAFQEAKLIGFFCSPKVRAMPVAKQMAHLLGLWHEIETKARKSKAGSMFSINTTSKIGPL